MAKIIRTASDDLSALDGEQTYFLYNGFDAALTHEIHGVIKPQISSPIYEFELALQAPALEMMLRGIRVDEFIRRKMIDQNRKEIDQLQVILNEQAFAVWGKELNPASPKQLSDFFYGAMRIPPIRVVVQGEAKISTNREALEKMEAYFYAQPIIRCILAIRDRQKSLGALLSSVDSDGRMRTSYNIAGTETGRWSSSENAFGSGTNLQNIRDELRRIFVADPGYKLAYIDLEQAESKVVAALIVMESGDRAYYNACNSGDLHTSVCRLIWPDLPWTGNPRDDKAIASAPFYRHFSFRDMAKRGGHATNYYARPQTISRHLKIALPIANEFHRKYLSAFRGMSAWHTSTARRLQTEGRLETPFGRSRAFLGRRYDDTTLREAIAYIPQSVVGDALNLGLYRLWREQSRRPWQILAQIHDAVLLQYPEHLESILIPQIISLVKFSSRVHPVDLIIPAEAQVGWNWAKAGPNNPDGMRKWSEGDGGRQRSNESILDRRL